MASGDNAENVSNLLFNDAGLKLLQKVQKFPFQEWKNVRVGLTSSVDFTKYKAKIISSIDDYGGYRDQERRLEYISNIESIINDAIISGRFGSAIFWARVQFKIGSDLYIGHNISTINDTSILVFRSQIMLCQLHYAIGEFKEAAFYAFDIEIDTQIHRLNGHFRIDPRFEKECQKFSSICNVILNLCGSKTNIIGMQEIAVQKSRLDFYYDFDKFRKQDELDYVAPDTARSVYLKRMKRLLEIDQIIQKVAIDKENREALSSINEAESELKFKKLLAQNYIPPEPKKTANKKPTDKNNNMPTPPPDLKGPTNNKEVKSAASSTKSKTPVPQPAPIITTNQKKPSSKKKKNKTNNNNSSSTTRTSSTNSKSFKSTTSHNVLPSQIKSPSPDNASSFDGKSFGEEEQDIPSISDPKVVDFDLNENYNDDQQNQPVNNGTLMTVCDHIRDNYQIKWACNSCTLSMRTKDAQRLTASRDHKILANVEGSTLQCLENVLLVNANSAAQSKVTRWFSKIRDPWQIVPNFESVDEILMCQILLERECPHDDKCVWPHNSAEQTIWTMVKNNQRGSFLELLKKSSFTVAQLVQKTERIVAISKPKPSQNLAREFSLPTSHVQITIENLNIASACKKVVNSECQETKIPSPISTKDDSGFQTVHRNKTSVSDNLSLTEALDAYCSLDEPVLDLMKQVPLLASFTFFVACDQCYNRVNQEMINKQHKCSQDLLFCHDRSFGDSPVWSLVRSMGSKQNPSKLCSNVSTCPKGEKCPMPHNRVELQAWSQRQQFLKVIKSCVLNEKMALQKTYWNMAPVFIWFGCQECAALVTSAYYSVLLFKHQCRQDLALFRSENSNVKLWHLVRARPEVAKTYIDMCHHLNVPGGCYMHKVCRFSHSHIESKFWEMDLHGQLNLNQFLQNERELWRAELSKKDLLQYLTYYGPPLESTDNNYKYARNRNPSSISRNESQHSDAASVSSDILDKFTICYICKACFEKHNNIVSVSDSAVCKRNHTWRSNRTLAALVSRFPDSGVSTTTGVFKNEAILLRYIPDHVLSGKFNIVKICKVVAGGDVCSREICIFAHSELERQIWTYLLQNKPGKNVDYLLQQQNTNKTVQKTPISNTVPEPTIYRQTEPPAQPVWNGKNTAGLFKDEDDDNSYCFLCDKFFMDANAYREHAMLDELHRYLMNNDRKRMWSCRKPRTSKPFSMCQRNKTDESCEFSRNERHNRCPYAHSYNELAEWNDRVDLAQKTMKRYKVY